MSIQGIKKDIEQLKKKVNFEDKPGSTEERFWKCINQERISEGKRPVIFIWDDFKNCMVNEIFYEPNLEKIDEFRIPEGKIPLLPLYLAGEYKKVENELQKYENIFFMKIPRSTLLTEMLQPVADELGFDDINGFNEAERLFMQDQKLYHLHLKPELNREFIEYLIREREKEGANQLFDNNNLIKITTEQIIPENIKKYLTPLNSCTDEYRFTTTVKRMGSFKFEDSMAVPGQTITLKYTQTGQYIDQGEWSVGYSHVGKILPINNIALWSWVHQRDINRRINEIIKEPDENEPIAT
jgi:hypothetical protein